MFDLNTADANPAVAGKWLVFAGINTATSGALTLATAVDRIKSIFPAKVLEQLPNYQQFIYLALAIAFVTALPLGFIRKVFCLSFAELGVASSLLYLGCALFGVFANGYEKVLLILLLVMILVLVVTFSSGIMFATHEKQWSDAVLGIGVLIVFVGVWLYPLFKIWRPQ
jgi:ABC-type dipeptide/oligopeptide/nickel transport system permease component